MYNDFKSGLTAFLAAIVLSAGGSALALDQPANTNPPSPAPATQPAPPAANQPAWVSQCSASTRQAALECAIEVRLFVTNTSQLVAAVTVRIPADTNKPVMMIQAPLGLFLPAGISIAVDGADPQRLDLQTCDAGGCYAGSPLADEFVARMSKGQKLNISFENLNKQSISIPVSLTGFTAALQNIR